ncbi:MAG: hypothetical protein WCC04_04605 [Terriglobales bacterium]
MTEQYGVWTWRVLRLAMVGAAFMAAVAAYASPGSDQQGSYTEEFHKVYPLSAQGRIEIANVNGPSPYRRLGPA